MTVDQQKQRAWHDDYYRQRGKVTTVDGDKPQDKFYVITASAHRYFREFVYEGCTGKNILDYCCGTGHEAVRLAKAGATVTGIDISPVAVQIAREVACEEGMDEVVTFLDMPAEQTTLPDDSFDIVFGLGALHHLNLRDAYAEVARVLKPEGRAIFSEPVGYNPVCNGYRRLTARMRTADEHRLRRSDYLMARDYFQSMSLRFFSLSTFGAVPFRNYAVFHPLLRFLERVDHVLFKLPAAKWFAWRCIVELRYPIKS